MEAVSKVAKSDQRSTTTNATIVPIAPARLFLPVSQTDCAKFGWMRLAARLREDSCLRALLKFHFTAFFVSAKSLLQDRSLHTEAKVVAAEFGPQNCIRALSMLEDCTDVKKNQYKWMFEGLTLSAAIEMLVREAKYLHGNLAKLPDCGKTLLRLLHNWIDYLMVIHRVPEDAERQLRPLIVEHIALNLNLRLA